MADVNNFISLKTWNMLVHKISAPAVGAALLKIALILVVSIIIIKLATFFVAKLVRLIEKSNIAADERTKLRTHTIKSIINNSIIVFVSIISLILILSESGINIAPVLAGAGVLGLAVSFGAQNLVKDVITGFFILLEDQYGIGDIVQIGDNAGVVENMNLRTTILRDLNGNVHIIPNGEIKQVTVMTKLWSRALVDVKIHYKQDIQQVMDIISEEANRLKDELPDAILDTPDILGVNSIDPNGVTIRVVMKTKPAQQWNVERELRKRIIARFNSLGIELPFLTPMGYTDQ